MEIQIDNAYITSFGWTATANIYDRTIKFETAPMTVYSSIIGIAFSVQDSLGVELLSVDWNSPQIIPSGDTFYVLDLSSSPLPFLFQNYKIIGYIKDTAGTVYNTPEMFKGIKEPVGITDSGYVPGLFQLTPDCTNNVLTVRELTTLIYNNASPITVTKSGTLSYPTGTISPVAFTGTPFSNTQVRTGEHRIVCTTLATYDLGDGFYVLVTYYTNSPFPITCANFIGQIICCTSEAYNNYLKNCDNSIGQAWLQKYNSILPSFVNGLGKQINGQDSSAEVAYIKKILNCDCGTSINAQNEATPTDPAVYSIVLTGAGGTTIGSPVINGHTKTYTIASKAYITSKADLGDLAYTITVDNSVSNQVSYKIKFNYDVMAGYILDAIEDDPNLITQLNELVTTGISLVGLDGKCVISLSTSNYALSQAVTGSTEITNIVINGTNFAAPTNTMANNATAVAAWLNSLSLGTFTAVVVDGTLTIQSVNNPSTLSTATFTLPGITKQFSSTNATLVQVLQAIINYICNLTAAQVALSNNLNLCTFDYNGDIVTTTFLATSSQASYNAGVASAICNLVTRINSISAVTCAALKAIFIDRVDSSFVGASARIYGLDQDGNCTGFTPLQIGLGVMNSVTAYAAVKEMFCAVDCTSPATCPEVSNSSLAMNGGDIGVYGLTWATTPSASQSVSVRYRVSGGTTWTTASNALLILPNGNISGTTPFIISGVIAGETYDVWLQNNCGGTGFVKQITVPTGSVYSGNYLLENTLYDICGATPAPLYSSQPFASGVIMYSDIGLTTPVTGYTYITINGSNIFTINTSTGVVGTDTGSSCDNGTAGQYQLGNSTSTICASGYVTLYTNGLFAVGQVVYTDEALSTPQTGYSYITYNSVMYTMNSVTGAVTGNAGLSCINYTLNAAFNLSINSVTGTGVPTLPATGVNGSQSGHHIAMSGSYTVVVSGTVVVPTKLVAFVNGGQVDCVAIPSAGSYGLTIAATEGQTVVLTINNGTC